MSLLPSQRLDNIRVRNLGKEKVKRDENIFYTNHCTTVTMAQNTTVGMA